MRDRDAMCVRKRDAARDKQEQPNRVEQSSQAQGCSLSESRLVGWDRWCDWLVCLLIVVLGR